MNIIKTLSRQRQPEIINVLDFKDVTGDGIHDDSKAINRIIRRYQGKTIYFPKGQYLAHLIIDVDTNLVFEFGASIFWVKTSTPVIRINKNSNCKISGDLIINSLHPDGIGLQNDGSVHCQGVVINAKQPTKSDDTKTTFSNCQFRTKHANSII